MLVNSLNFLKPWLVESPAPVIIPLYDGVLFVRLFNCTPLPRSVFRSCPNPRPDLRDSVPRLWQTALPTAASWRDLNQESPHGAAGAAGGVHAAWVSFV